MIKASFTYHKTQESLIWQAGFACMLRATVYYWQQIQHELNRPNAGVRMGRGRKRFFPSWREAIARGLSPTPSAPGESPKKRTGHLAGWIQYEADEANLETRIGAVVAAKYAIFLELGTRIMAARPFILATLFKYWGRIKALAENNP